MCGIAGFLDPGTNRDTSETRLNQMTDALTHRGPDAKGIWIDKEVGLHLGHRRLSILDLSDEGAQPMHSSCGRFVITFNGEIYNYLGIKKDLEKEGRAFRGHSDTETFIEGISHWGLDKTIARANGMFAFALWDKKERTLFLGRDRVGEKPLYYGHRGTELVFSSELKSFFKYDSSWKDINQKVLGEFLRFACVPEGDSIIEGIKKLPPGCILKWKWNPNKVESELVPYWDLAQAVRQGKKSPFQGSFEDAVDEIHGGLKRVIKDQMISDVPLGVFLSGGIDSSVITAIMQEVSSEKVKSFTVGFSEGEFNEASEAARVAEILGTSHTEEILTDQDSLSIIDRLADFYDEPFADESMIPTTLISGVARKSVTVCLSGDGGDEVFGGYNRYIWGPKIWKVLEGTPNILKFSAEKAMAALPDHLLDSLHKFMGDRVAYPKEKLQKFRELILASSREELYQRVISYFQRPEEYVLKSDQVGAYQSKESPPNLGDFEWMRYQDLLGYLVDDILVKVDRAAMSVSLETRVPFLDHQLMELVLSMPSDYLIRETNGKTRGKAPLRAILEKYISKEVYERPKAGFAVPIGAWLKKDLKPWAEDLLSDSRIKSQGLFQSEGVQRIWKQHQDGQYDHNYRLWALLMFQSWHQKWIQ